MIRTLWVGIVIAAATYFYGAIAIIAALLRVRGEIYTWATQEWARAILKASGTRVVVHGLENIRPHEPQIIVSNHLSGYDIFAIAAVLPSPFHFVAKKELERIPFFGRAWKAAGHIAIDRSNRHKAVASLQQAARKIRKDRANVIIFAEGTRSRTGELLPLKKGAFVLAVEARVPVIPTVITGTEHLVTRGPLRVRPGPVRLEFGAPIFQDQSSDDAAERLLEETETRMRRMLERHRREKGNG